VHPALGKVAAEYSRSETTFGLSGKYLKDRVRSKALGSAKNRNDPQKPDCCEVALSQVNESESSTEAPEDPERVKRRHVRVIC